MFKNKALYIQTVDRQTISGTTNLIDSSTDLDLDKINDLLLMQVANVAKQVTIVMAIGIGLNTASKLIVKHL